MTALETLGWILVHSAWQVAIVAGMLALFLRVGRASTRLRYASAFGALLVLVALPLVTAIVLPAVDGDPSGGSMRPGRLDASTAAGPIFAIGAALAPTIEWLAVAWLAAVVVLLARWVGGWWVVAGLRWRATRPARPAWSASLHSAAARIGVASPVELLESTHVDTPTVIGHRRPVVLLPIPAFESLVTDEAESILAHELAHVRRGDFVANAMQTVVEILFFFHPAVRWLSRTVREERERCCDDVAVEAARSRLVYARALEHLEQLRSSVGTGGLALGANGGALLRRIERLADHTNGSERDSVALRLVLTLGTAATLASLAMLGSRIVPPTIHAQAAVHRYTVRAHDPAGEFTITFERGRPTRATIDGIAVSGDRLLSRGDSLLLPWGDTRRFAVRLRRDGFTWTPRSP